MLDPITFSVVLSRFNAIAKEMTLTLEQTAYTSLLALARDYSCAIYDAVPRQICMFDAIPVHTTSMHLVLEEIARTFTGDVGEGDVFVCNHPYRGNTHVGDLVIAAPVFIDGHLAFWSVTKGHQQDIGAFIASSVAISAKDVWQEGLLIPPIKIREGGRERSDVVELYLSNVRYPELLRGDLLAQLASVERGKTRLLELDDELGAAELGRYVDAIIDYSDRRMSEQIAAIPDGDYRGVAWLDSGGGEELDVPIVATVRVRGDEIEVDCTGSGAQSPTGMNGTYASAVAGAGMTFMCYVDDDIPRNHGCLRHIHVRVPEGTVCNARYPASTAAATITPPNQLFEAINKAMVAAVPDLVAAGGAKTNNMPDFAGVDERTGRAWGVMLFNNNGGQGASKGADGWPLWGAANAMGGLKSLSVEQIELLYPLLVEEWEVVPDSAGLGEWIGGPGNRMVIRPTQARILCTTFGDGYRNPPPGLLGGTPGHGGGQLVESHMTGRRRFVSAIGHFRIDPDEAWIGESTGGGGYGIPVDRDPERVRRDVRDGLFTRRMARDVFGVVVSDDFDPVVDADATSRLRAELRRVERPLVDPSVPGAGTWLEQRLREGDVYLVNPFEP